MNINNKFSHGDIVYLVTDPDQFERIITRLIVEFNQTIIYEIRCGVYTSLHHEQELSGQKNMNIALGLDRAKG